jgi:hypothetical protein
MKILNLFKKKCFFCKNVKEKKNRFLTHMINFGMYGETISCYYHNNCFKQVLDKPEIFSNKILDMAIDISDKIKLDEKKRTNKISIIRKF